MRRLIFISAGDHATLDLYRVRVPGDYDLYITYYGDSPAQKTRLKGVANHFNVRKGSKLQNFHHLWQTTPAVREYDYYLLMDDDIAMSQTELGYMFETLHKYNAWLIQPSFKKTGRISHAITAQVPGSLLRFVNFVEVTCMFMSKDAITRSMAAYDPVLIGWGIDYLFIQTLGRHEKDKYIVVDKVAVCNPIRVPRELECADGYAKREMMWRRLATSRKLLTGWKHETYHEIADSG